MPRAIITIACFTFIEAARAHLTRLLLVLLAAFAGSLFINEIAIADSQRIQTAFLAASLRPASVFILSLFIISSLAREFSEKGLELILSLDLPRASHVLGKQLGFMGIALLLAAGVSLPLAAFAPPSQAALWGLSLPGGRLANNTLNDPHEIRFLTERLNALEARHVENPSPLSRSQQH